MQVNGTGGGQAFDGIGAAGYIRSALEPITWIDHFGGNPPSKIRNGGKSMSRASGRCARIAVVFAVVLALALGGVALGAGVVAAEEPDDVDLDDLEGEGSSEEPYVLTNASELQAMEDELDAHYELGEDIDATETEDWFDGAGFDPIGDGATSFTAEFNGNGFRISNLTIDRQEEEYVGLFGRTSGASIDDVRLKQVSIHGDERVGGLAGMFDSGSATNASVSGQITAENRTVGGLIGHANDADLINRLAATGTVTSKSPEGAEGVGGLIGRSSGGSDVRNAYTNTTVSGSHAGGILGRASSSASIYQDMYAASPVEDGGTGDDTGAIVGIVADSGDVYEDSIYYDSDLEGGSVFGADRDSGSATNEIVSLETAEIQGETADSNMPGLDFDLTWRTVAGDYPIFDWQIEAADSPTNIELQTPRVTAGDGVLRVRLSDFDIGVEGQNITLLSEGDIGDLSGAEPGIEAETDGSGDATFTLDETDGGEYDLTFETVDESVTKSTTIIVEGAEPDTLESTNPTKPLEVEGELLVTGEDEFGNDLGKDSSLEILDDDGLNIDQSAETNASGVAKFGFTGTVVDDFTVQIGSSEPSATATAQVTIETPQCEALEPYEVQDGYKQVDSPATLQCMAADPDADYELVESVNLTAANVSAWNDGDGFEPIGDETTPFTGEIRDARGGETVEAFDTVGEQTWDVPVGVDAVTVLVVGGGGGGGGQEQFSGAGGGGGGAGGLVFVPDYDLSEDRIDVTVGEGGAAGGDSGGSQAEPGENSRFGELVAIGGGEGEVDNIQVGDGGSGGGGRTNGKDPGRGIQPDQPGQSGAPFGFGNDGGQDSDNDDGGGGGGGAGEPGQDPDLDTTGDGGDGGDGLNEVEIAGETYNFAELFGTEYGEVIDGEVWFAGGGGGGSDDSGSKSTVGGKGGGGDGERSTITPGTPNTGGGGGAGNQDNMGEDGGSGVVLLQYEPANEIEGLEIYSEEDNVGLFGLVGDDGNVEGITVKDATINGQDNVGTVAGTSDGTIQNVSSTGSVDGATDVGGLVGNANSFLSTVDADVNVSGDERVGGLAGGFDASLEDTTASGNVSGTSEVGGLIGATTTEADINQSYATGNVSSEQDSVGGLLGSNGGAVTESYATGAVDGGNDAGGLIGSNSGSLSKTYAVGSVNGDETVGGLVGEHTGSEAIINRSFATGGVTGDGNLGGLVGLTEDGAAVEDNTAYWDEPNTGQFSSAGGTGLLSDEMTGDEATTSMSGLDFDDRWNTVQASDTNVDEDGYPILQRLERQPQLSVSEADEPRLSVDSIDIEDIIEGQSVEPDVVVSELEDTTTSGLNISLEIERDGGETVFHESKEGTELRDESATFSFSVGTLSDPDEYTATATADADNADEETEVDSFTVEEAESPTCSDVNYNTDGDTLLIETLEQLQCIGSDHDDADDLDDALSSDYRLTADIDATPTSDWNDENGFEPLGEDESSPFTGTFDGNGNTIQNLTIHRSSDYVGLIGYAEASSAAVDDLRLENVDIEGGDEYGAVGGLAGWFRYGDINNVSVSGSVTGHVDLDEGSGDGGVGGVVGMFGDAESEALVFTGTVEGDRRVGGLIGHTGFETDVAIGYAQADVSVQEDDQHAGGLIGFTSNNPSLYSDMYAAGSVTGDKAGGVVGHAATTNEQDPHEFTESIYWDEDKTTDPVGEIDVESELDDNWEGLTTDEMQGESAEDELGELDFQDTWATVPDDYPVFQWEAGARDDPDELSVDSELEVNANDGEATITALEDGVPVEGIGIEVEDNADDLDGLDEGDQETTDGSGEATFQFGETDTGDYQVTFGIVGEPIDATTTITVTGNPNELDSLDADDVTVEEGDSGTIDVTLEDEFDNPVSDQPIEVTDNSSLSGLIEGTELDTDSDGIASFGFQESSPGDYDVTFEGPDGLTDTATVTVEETEATLSIEPFTIDDKTEGDELDLEVTVEETGGIETDGLEVELDLEDSDGTVFTDTIADTELEDDDAAFDFTATDSLDPEDYTATVTADADNADEVTEEDTFEVEEDDDDDDTGGGGGGGTGGTGGTDDDSGTEVIVENGDDDDEATDDETADETDDDAADDDTTDDTADEPTDDSPDTSVSVVDPEPGQTLVIENGEARIVDDSDADADEEPADDEADTDEQADADDTADQPDADDLGADDDPDPETDDADDGDTGTGTGPTNNVRAERLEVEIDTTNDFDLSMTTYETDLSRTTDAGGIDAAGSLAPAAQSPLAGSDLMLATASLGMAGEPAADVEEEALAPQEVQAAADAFEDETATVSAGYVHIEHSLEPEEIAGATFEFSIRRAYLEDLGVEPAEVELHHQDDGEWVDRETTYIESDDTFHRFEGTMPAFSVFALGTGAATVDVTETDISVSMFETGEDGTVSVEVENRGLSPAEETVSISHNGSEVDTESVSLEGQSSEEVALSTNAFGDHTLMLGDTEIGTVSIDESDRTPRWPLALVVGAILVGVAIWRRRDDEDKNADLI